MKTILHIASIAPLNDLYERLFGKFLDERFDQVVFIPCNSKKTGAYEFKNAKLREQVPLATQVVSNKFLRFIFYPKFWINSRSLLSFLTGKDIKYSFAHTAMTDGVLAYYLFRKYDIPYTITVQSTDVNFFIKKFFFLRPLAKKIIENADRIIFLNGGYKNKLKALFSDERLLKRIEEKSELIPYGVDEYWVLNKKSKGRTELGDKKVKCLFVGRLLKLKNIENTIKAIIDLNKKGLDIELTFVGGNYDGLGTVLSYQKSHPKLIRYSGPIYDKDKLIEIYSSHDIFIMPSFTESFGLVYIEAISQGMPVIYSFEEGIYGIFKEGFVGYGPDPKKIGEIMSSILSIRENYGKMSYNCINSINMFKWDTILNKYCEILKIKLGE